MLVEPVGAETVVYDLETKQAHCLKPLAALVFESCDGEKSVSTIAHLASERLGAAVTADEVAEAVSQLESLALLDTPLVVHDGNGAMSSNGNGVSRREMLRRVGFAGAAAAVGTSLVTSIAPSTALALSGLPGGCSGCAANANCATGACCTTVVTVGAVTLTCVNTGCCVAPTHSCIIGVLGCHCVGGSANGVLCSANAGCPGGLCKCDCRVLRANAGCSSATTCPCATCPTGSESCCALV